jgi:hypothetical protein
MGLANISVDLAAECATDRNFQQRFAADYKYTAVPSEMSEPEMSGDDIKRREKGSNEKQVAR